MTPVYARAIREKSYDQAVIEQATDLTSSRPQARAN